LILKLPITKSCITKRLSDSGFPTDKKFTAAVTGFTNLRCAGSNDGTITIAADNYPAAGFYYSVDGCFFIQSATSPVTIGVYQHLLTRLEYSMIQVLVCLIYPKRSLPQQLLRYRQV
jgi:hypothetical protein